MVFLLFSLISISPSILILISFWYLLKVVSLVISISPSGNSFHFFPPYHGFFVSRICASWVQSIMMSNSLCDEFEIRVQTNNIKDMRVLPWVIVIIICSLFKCLNDSFNNLDPVRLTEMTGNQYYEFICGWFLLILLVFMIRCQNQKIGNSRQFHFAATTKIHLMQCHITGAASYIWLPISGPF